MADGFGAYYSSHARGATFQAKRFADVMNAAFVVGDCAFTNPGHHGTAKMLDRFDANYPTLIAPDAR